MPEDERTIIEIPANPISRERGPGASPLRVAAYCRVSTGSEEQLSNYYSQIEYYKTKIQENPDWEFADIFADEGLSGTSTKKRIEFNKMIQKCRRGKIDLIITKSVSRFVRNSLDCIEYIRKLKAMGVGIFFEKENINTLEDPDETFLTIMSILAQEESMSLSQNVRMGIRQGFKAGKVPFHSLLGYHLGEDGNYKIVPEEAEIVQRIFERYLSGQSVGQIRKGLEAEGVLTKQGNSNWSEATVQNILRNEKYMGAALLQKTFIESPLTKKSIKNTGQFPQYYIENNHKPIIDRETFNRVQEEIARRASKRKLPARDARTDSPKYSGKFALSEILVCGECGARYRRTTWAKPEGGRRPVWRCISRLEHGKKYCKHSVTLDEQELHEIIRTSINQVIFKELLLEALADNAVETGMPELVPDLSTMFWSDLPELEEYDDSYTRLLFDDIKVEGKQVHITFMDGTSVVRSV